MEEYFKDSDLFLKAAKKYAKEINGIIDLSNNVPYIGFCIYNFNEGKYKNVKYFYIRSKYLTEDFLETFSDDKMSNILLESIYMDKIRQEVSKNQTYIQDRCGLNPSVGSNLVFVNGSLYTGDQIFNCYKGIGWPQGRPISIKLSEVVDTAADVCYIATDFGKLRKCKFNFKTGEWDILTKDVEDNI